jgi:hypothetical protein
MPNADARETMERADREITQYATKETKWPSDLKPAAEIAPLVHISEERLLELAESGFVPHWRIDGGEPLFRKSEVREWSLRNLAAQIPGRQLPVEIRVTMTPTTFPAVDAPTCIRDVPNLVEIPTNYPTGIYFLVHDGEVVYVGQSINPTARILQHILDGSKKFSRAYLVPVPVSRLNEVEAALIRCLRPPCNKTPVVGGGDEDLRLIEEFCPGITDLNTSHTARRREQREAREAEWRAKHAQ